MKVEERFLDYISVDTTSLDDTGTYPSTENQWILARQLKEEMEHIGMEDVELDSYGYVTGTIPANTDREVPVLGLISHMDTSDAVSGSDIKANIFLYNGGDILLNEEKSLWLRTEEYPELETYIGQHLIVTDGTTLLGADDKAGIAEIMTFAESLINDPSISHGRIRIAFTPDEEIGEGTKYFDVSKFGADYAFTVDGGKIGEFVYENFNGAGAKITFHGKSMHPGSAKGHMVNAVLLAMEFQDMLPHDERPMYTEGYEGFYHLYKIAGDVECCTLEYIIRDHDRDLFEQRKREIKEIAHCMNEKYGSHTVEVSMQDSYYNMKEVILQHEKLIENALAAYRECGIEPFIEPIRGGTDGARLSFKGLPCPNLSTGGHNFHSVYEYIPVESMEKMVDVLLKLAKKFAAEM